MPYDITQKVNNFALRAFRDTADKDYIHARMAYKADLFPQFHWSALHALEKYAKCILILARIPKPKNREERVLHEVKKSLRLMENIIDIQLSIGSREFISQLEDFGARFRYLEVSWSVRNYEILFLDQAVWELRRFCNSEVFNYLDDKLVSVNLEIYNQIKHIDKPTKANTYLRDGFIERTLENSNSSTRISLVWNNLYYSTSKRKRVRVKAKMMAENAPFLSYPEIINEVRKYTFIPKEIVDAYASN